MPPLPLSAAKRSRRVGAPLARPPLRRRTERSSWFRVALVSLALIGCPKAPPQHSAPLPDLSPEAQLRVEVAALQDRARSLVKTQDEILWKSWTEGTPLDFGKTADDGKTLYTRDGIDKIARLRAATGDPLDARALDQLKLHFTGEHLARATAMEASALSHQEAATRFKLAQSEHTLRELDRLLARERNSLHRQAIWAAAMLQLPRLDSAYAARDLRTREALDELGYGSALDFAAELRRIDDDGLAMDAQRVLEVTEAPFRSVLEQLSTHGLRMSFDRVRMRDLPRMFRSRDVDDLFPKDPSSSRVNSTLEALGVPLTSLPQLKIDARESASKNPLPFALAVEVPHDVRLSLRPLPGLRSQSAHLHEVGHALHSALTTETRYPLAKLGMGSVSEAWSQLFELLVEDPVWLGQKTGLGGARLDRYLAASAAWDLYLLRRAAARFLYSRELLASADADPRALYKTFMSKALLVKIEDEDLARARFDQDLFLDSATQLEAAFLAHQLQSQLKARFGPSWWTTKEAGLYLRPLWAHGNALNARELARLAGDERLAPDALLLRLTSTLKVPIAVPPGPEEEQERDE